ncbi:hypothetical protein [Halobacillus halophilus]|uniref:hypothetical protein n=1 Tax=Halobacillus halophilus TaxID=1570 RepID=UPI001CD48E04|nr:hypothetical protein [Halobacillus halophilus]MCA1010336.1 hypothetical protein [Halobacillus halophilus]
MAAETARFPAGELASLLARFTPCGVSPSSFSRGSLVVSSATPAISHERTLAVEKAGSFNRLKRFYSAAYTFDRLRI